MTGHVGTMDLLIIAINFHRYITKEILYNTIDTRYYYTGAYTIRGTGK